MNERDIETIYSVDGMIASEAQFPGGSAITTDLLYRRVSEGDASNYKESTPLFKQLKVQLQSGLFILPKFEQQTLLNN